MIFGICLKTLKQRVPWWSSGQDSKLPLQRAWVQSLTWELRSHPLHCTDKILRTNKGTQTGVPTATVKVINGKTGQMLVTEDRIFHNKKNFFYFIYRIFKKVFWRLALTS